MALLVTLLKKSGTYYALLDAKERALNNTDKTCLEGAYIEIRAKNRQLCSVVGSIINYL